MSDQSEDASTETGDEIWLLEHPKVYTQGTACDQQTLMPSDIPIVASDRGGQITYHGPGQIVMYPLLSLRRHELTVKGLVTTLEQAVINLLQGWNIAAERQEGAPGIYVAGEKISALGLRIRRGWSYHGLSLNVDMDLQPFANIDPCGYVGLRTTQLKDQRPDLYVHGLSQGAFNSQATLPLFDMLADPIKGAFWAGSPFFSRYWSEVRDNRNPESPAWRPTYGNGSIVRVMDQYGGLEGNYAPWGPIKTVFLNYGSDPIVNFTFDSAIKPPAWLEAPRAPDVTDKLSWFPGVTMLQLALDSIFALNVPRFGHYYIAPDYIDGWAAVVEPEGWSAERA